ncbi:MAG: hypothetical protein KDD48_04110 [Bdellovibrionales bacterium]|nr:hypothetical protein [Bdellovibrionales bacterium]
MRTFKFFITPVYPYGDDHYFHEMVALAEGLKELGYRVMGNVDYWKTPTKDTYLIEKNDSDDFDVGIYDYRYVRSFEHLLFRDGYPNFDLNKKHILVDRNDWISPIWLNRHYRLFSRIFSGNIFQTLKYPDNVRPWAIGLSSRMIQSIDKYYGQLSKPMSLSIGHNFRVMNGSRHIIMHHLKQLEKTYPLKECFTIGEPIDKSDLFYFHQTTRRHHPEYFKSINENRFFLAVCGYFECRPILYQPYSLLDRIVRKPVLVLNRLLTRLKCDSSYLWFAFQHDSFRFYETLYAKTCPIQIDLNYWKFRMPVQPSSGIHYLGIKGLDVETLITSIEAMSQSQIDDIAGQGREFVLRHYSPVAQAKRVIEELSI